ncbi:hypothetical protein [Streptomyces sp. NBC_00996]|uniref:hypothetical protein n=1 Tax=Streptomyces sp. NBC_00996 TaxID=2903710 RepID=UPI00386DF8E3|nr:hypothetical protein OG390_31470 [Streptomyces sp. NBC_00996]
MRRRGRATGVAVTGLAAAAVLSGCGSSGGSGNGAEGTGGAGGGGKAAAVPELKVPAGFDATRAWAVKASEGLTSPVVTPGGDVVLFVRQDTDANTATVVARDLKTGAVRWSGKPWKLPKPKDGGINSAALSVTSEKGKAYAVLNAYGSTGDDGVNKGTDVARTAAYAVESSGDAVAPVANAQVLGATGLGQMQDDGVMVLSTARDAGAVDVVSGAVTTYPDAKLKAPAEAKGCRDGFADCDVDPEFVAATPHGPLVNGVYTYWLSGTDGGGWYSENDRPSGASEASGDAKAIARLHAGGKALATRRTATGESLWTVQDAGTGALESSVTCENRYDGNDTQNKNPYRISTGGDYLINDVVAFDLKAKKGYCYGASSERNRIPLLSVDSTGTAYGFATKADSVGAVTETPASISLSSGKATPLAKGTLIPAQIGGDVAMFDDSSYADGQLPKGYTAVFAPRS